MADLSSLINPAAANSGQPQNPLSALMPNGGQLAAPFSAPPAPTHDQAVAGYHRMQETKMLMKRILDDPRAGKANIRPLVLEAGAKLISERLMTLSALMAGISDFPGADDPMAQKQWVRRLFTVNAMAQRKLLQDHRAANPPDGQHGAPWNADQHNDNMAGLMAHYPGQN
jgi:hypothetical protein